MALRGQPSARVAVPSGSVYPDGIPVQPANPAVNSTVRPEGWLFRSSVGYASIRPGRQQFQSGHHGLGIGFTPMRYAEDVARQEEGLPGLVDQDAQLKHADIRDIPGSEMLTSEGLLDPDFVADNRGVKVGKGTSFPQDDAQRDVHDAHRTPADMGDRDPDRPLTRAHLMGYLRDPTTMFRQEWHQRPALALAIAGVGVTVAYVVGRDFERIWARRRSNSPVRPLTDDVVDHPVKTTATAPVAAAETAVKEVERVADTAVKTVEGAAEAVEKTAEEAVETVSEAAEAATG